MRIVFLMVLLILSGCKWEGTGTGNPNHPSGMEDGKTSVDRIVGDICLLVKNCHDEVTFSKCYSGVSRHTGFAPRLGVVVDPSPTVGELMIAEIEGYIIPNTKSVDSCRSEIAKLQCDDEKVVKAYVSSEAEPFAGTSELLSPVCVGVFGEETE